MMSAVHCKAKLVCSVMCLAVLVTLGYLYRYSAADSQQLAAYDAQRVPDMFANDHIDVPEIAVRGVEAVLDKKQLKPNLVWHNNPAKAANNDKQMNTVYIENMARLKVDAKTNENELQDNLHKFNMLLNGWPVAKPKAVFYILTRLSRLTSLFTTLKSIDEYFNWRFNYPIILFHETELLPYLSSIRKSTNSTLFFQQVRFEVPSFLTERIQFDIPCLSPISYRHMCRFHARTIYEHPIMQQVDYYWRLDDDSLLLEPVKYDVFRFMKEHQLHYGYSLIFYDADSCVIGLWEATGRYIHERNIRACFFDKWPKPQLYYNNFEISSTQMWFSEQYKNYINYIDQLGGIYYHRWGDAPIHAIAVSLFLQKNQTHQFNDIGYRHGSYIHTSNGTRT